MCTEDNTGEEGDRRAVKRQSRTGKDGRKRIGEEKKAVHESGLRGGGRKGRRWYNVIAHSLRLFMSIIIIDTHRYSFSCKE